MLCPRRGLQQKSAAAALSQASRAEPDQSIRAIPAGLPHTPPADRMYATDRRQTDVRRASSLNASRVGHNNQTDVPNFQY